MELEEGLAATLSRRKACYEITKLISTANLETENTKLILHRKVWPAVIQKMKQYQQLLHPAEWLQILPK